MANVKAVPQPWSINESRELYAAHRWGQGMFSIGERGNLLAHPLLSDEGEEGPGIDLKALVDELVGRGISSPILLRFPDILSRRITDLNAAFQQAITELEYQGVYRGVYPIKVNQDRRVVERIVETGANFHYGLEAGSKPELLAVMAMLRDPEALVICNGYKDASYVETALLASRLGLRVILVVEKPGEIDLIHRVSERCGIPYRLGIRVKLSTKGAGRWESSGGDRSKFGLSSREMLQAVKRLESFGTLDRFQLLHFHLGSQISSIRNVKNALREASRYYTELRQLGAGLEYLDVGGGLGVDYDGSQTNFQSSMNYSLQEYANDVVWGIMEACDQAEVPHPTIVTEAGRAVTAHHAVLIVDVLGVNSVAPAVPDAPDDDAPPVVWNIWESYEALSRKNFIETYHDAADYKEEALQLFKLGHLSLEQRVHVETIFWRLATQILKIVRDLPHVPEEFEGLEQVLSDTYFCNFSVFQSLPDSWAVNQLFPVMPIHRLEEKPTRRGVLADITCDSDGQISQFIDLRDVKDVLELHPFDVEHPYYLGIFLVGAYQEILGDLHNLFGDTNEVHVSASPDGSYRIDYVVEGNTVTEVLDYVGYDRKRLNGRLRQATEIALREKRMTIEESRTLMRVFEQGLAGYTYLESPGG